MGLPIKHRKKYVSHKKRWDKKVIVDEEVLVNDYALKNKKEIRKVELLLKKFKTIAKELNRTDELKQSEQAQHFLTSLKAKGFLAQEATRLDEVLDLGLRDILERRLSNIVYRLKLAKTPSQARQFVSHKHITVGGKLVDSPSYSVSLSEEVTISFASNTALFDENHPERKLNVEGMEEQIEELEETPEVKKGPTPEQEAREDDAEVDEVKE